MQLAQAKAEARSASRELQENVTWKEGWVATRLQKAERENSTVYLQVRQGGGGGAARAAGATAGAEAGAEAAVWVLVAGGHMCVHH